MIETNHHALSIKKQCELLEMSRSSFYYETTGESEENIELMRRIDELFTDNPTWGSRMMRDRLRLEGKKVNRKRIQRLMRKMAIQTISGTAGCIWSLLSTGIRNAYSASGFPTPWTGSSVWRCWKRRSENTVRPKYSIRTRGRSLPILILPESSKRLE
jgi:hypothetical protein